MNAYFRTQKAIAAPGRSLPDTAVRNMADMTGRLGLTAPSAAVPAAWPTGVSQLAMAIEACQRCDTAVVCTDWLARAPKALQTPPAFCPNVDEFKRAKGTK